MQQRPILLGLTLLLPALALAQNAPHVATVRDSWSWPAPASTVPYAQHTAHQPSVDEAGTHFTLKGRRFAPQRQVNAALAESGKAPFGFGAQGSGGRPAVNCARMPMDASCR